MDTQTIVTIIIALIVLAVVWKVIKGILRIGVTLAFIAIVAFVVLRALGGG